MLHKTILATPFRPSIAPLRTTFSMKVEYQHISCLAVLNHRHPRIFLPSLNHPNSFRIALLHGIHHRFAGCIQIHSGCISPFMERVHGIILGLAIKFGQLLIIQIRNFFETFIFRLQERRAVVAAPQTRISHIQAQLFLGIVRNHTAITWQYWMNAILTHSLQNLLLKLLLLYIPAIRIRTTPPFEVVHQPPSSKTGAGNKVIDFLFGIAQLGKYILPNGFCSRQSQGQVYTMQRHPIDFLLPTFPIPKCHGIGESTIVIGITIRKVGFVTFFLLDCRKHFRQIGRHTVPGKVYSGMVLQIPVDTSSDAYIIIASHHHLLTFLVKFKEVYRRLLLLDDEFLGSSLVDTLQQSIDWIGREGSDASQEKDERNEFFHSKK